MALDFYTDRERIEHINALLDDSASRLKAADGDKTAEIFYQQTAARYLVELCHSLKNHLDKSAAKSSPGKPLLDYLKALKHNKFTQRRLSPFEQVLSKQKSWFREIAELESTLYAKNLSRPSIFSKSNTPEPANDQIIAVSITQGEEHHWQNLSFSAIKNYQEDIEEVLSMSEDEDVEY